MNATATKITVHQLPPFAVNVIEQRDITICDDDRCAHNSHPAGVTEYDIELPVTSVSQDGGNSSSFTITQVVSPDGYGWRYEEEWKNNPYPVWYGWRNWEGEIV